ncbi:hypothetical protein MHK_005102 [Candidatus Magnetomorum sp. HK-1]|nr:hypothetical protein MHK_005102 [Candidatus Magnetomorum sp. HK-1]
MPQITYNQTRLTIISNNIDNHREITSTDHELFDSWLTSYHHATQSADASKSFQTIGKEIYQWLNNSDQLIERLMDEMVNPPFTIEFSIPKRPDANALRFLEVPWELLADDSGFLAGDPYVMFCPIRRLGNKQNISEPSPYRLSTVFMAASPEGVGHLRFEDEESAILDAVQGMGMDLTVEESGNLNLLADCMAMQEQVDVLHVSCHGQLNKQPLLILETEEGTLDPVSTDKFARRLGANRPRLLFLSACTTSEPLKNVDDTDKLENQNSHTTQFMSYASSMIRSGMPAVIGWSGSVRDIEATRFAKKLYDYLAHLESIESAVALSRLALLNPEDQKETVARDWHLARLYLGPSGGGIISKGKQARRIRDRDAGHKEFLNVKDQQIPVAGRHEFVGRRRQIQQILKEFRSETRTKAGILIHGFGRQGKSSLAARIAHRLPQHKPVIIYKYYDGPSILKAFSEFLGNMEIKTIVDNYLSKVRESSSYLEPALMELLNGPCKGLDQKSPPVLLILDDFERALEEPVQHELHTIISEYIESIQAIIRAFTNMDSRSCLLFTSRYKFTLPYQGKDLAQRLYDLQLPPMETYESQKQAEAKAKSLDQLEKELSPTHIQQCISASMGNPGLQDLLFSLSVEAKNVFENAIKKINDYANSGEFPTVEKLLLFMENLIIDDLLKVLTTDEKELVRASSLFNIPVPIGSLEHIAKKCGFKTGSPFGSRLFALGIWEQYDFSFQEKEKTVAINALVRPKAGKLSEQEEIHLAQQIIEDLFERMGGVDSRTRTYVADYELARLALLAKNTDVLLATAQDAITGLEKQFLYKTAANLSIQAIRELENVQKTVPTWLYLNANQVCETVGKINQAKYFVEQAIKNLQNPNIEKNGISNFDMASALLRQGRLLINSGQPEKAIDTFEEARKLFKLENNLKDQAIIAGEIARIKVDRGEVDEALRLHQEELNVYEELGDQRSRAVTLGYIARIKVSRGEVDEALRLQNERLIVNKKLNDQDGIGAALYDIALIELQNENYKNALDALLESYQIFIKIGRLDFLCYVGLQLGQLLCYFNQTEEGLAILKRSKEGFIQLQQPQMAQQVDEIMKDI